MRVLTISHGAFVHAPPYMLHMVRAGWEVHWLKIAPGALSVEGVTEHQGYRQGVRACKLGKLEYIASGLRCRKLVRRIAPDIIHGQYASSAGVVAWLSGYRPYALTVHGSDLVYWARSGPRRAAFGRVLRGAALVNPVARHMLDLLARMKVPQERIFTRSYGIPIERFPFHPAADLFARGVRVLCMRSMANEVYDMPTLLRAVAEARRLGGAVALSLPATGALAPKMRALAGELGLDQAVRFGSGYRSEDVPGMMADHDVYVSAARWDGTSLSLLEAMACGAFPVVTDTPANREWLEDGRTALFFAPGDWRTLAEILLSLPQRRELIAQAVRINRQVAETHGDRTASLDALMSRLEAAARHA